MTAFEQGKSTKLGHLTANADMSTHQNKFVKASGNAQFQLASVAGERVLGVLDNNPRANQPGTIVCVGVVMVEAGATIAVNDPIRVGASATAIVATTGQYFVGVALTAGASGELVTVMLNCINGTLP